MGKLLIINIYCFFNNTFASLFELKKVWPIVKKEKKILVTVCSVSRLSYGQYNSFTNNQDGQSAREHNEKKIQECRDLLKKKEKKDNQLNPLDTLIKQAKDRLNCKCGDLLLVGDNSKIYKTFSVELYELKKTFKEQLDLAELLSLNFLTDNQKKIISNILNKDNDSFNINDQFTSFYKLIDDIKDFQKNESELRELFLKKFNISLKDLYNQLNSNPNPIEQKKLKAINERWEKALTEDKDAVNKIFKKFQLDTIKKDDDILIQFNWISRGFPKIKESPIIILEIAKILFQELTMDIQKIYKSLTPLQFADVSVWITRDSLIKKNNRDSKNKDFSKIDWELKKSINKYIDSFIDEKKELQALQIFFNNLQLILNYFDNPNDQNTKEKIYLMLNIKPTKNWAEKARKPLSDYWNGSEQNPNNIDPLYKNLHSIMHNSLGQMVMADNN